MAFDYTLYIITFITLAIVTKLVTTRNHLLNFLLILEGLIIIVYAMIVLKGYIIMSTSTIMFFFLVLIVSGACLGMALLAAWSRSEALELELLYMKL